MRSSISSKIYPVTQAQYEYNILEERINEFLDSINVI